MVSVRHHLADFANMFKAFIGSNYLSISFAFLQSGMALGVIILVVVVLMTEHCCNLIVRCKRLMLRSVFAQLPVLDDGTESLETSEAKAMLNKKTNMGDIGEHTFGLPGRMLVNASLFITQFGFCVNYFIFIGNTLYVIFPLRNETVVNESTDEVEFEEVSTAPNLILLCASPLPIFVAFSLLRSVRKLGFVSIVANISIFVGCVVIFSYIVSGFHVNPTFAWFNWSTAPVTLGLVVSAFEGIGTILPIEGSMVGNQHNYRRFLIGGISGVALILSVFGVLGYLKYGSDTEQLLVQNIPHSSVLSGIVDVTLIIGVIFTFPLQQVPVVTMVEIVLFTRGGLFRRNSSASMDQDPLLGNSADDINTSGEYGAIPRVDDQGRDVEEDTISHVDRYRILASNWQRCIVRVLVVLAELGVAIAMRDKYAYVSAFTGALGSTFLAFIVPCAAHLRLAWHESSILVKAKDFLFIVIGFAISIVSLTVTLMKIIE